MDAKLGLYCNRLRRTRKLAGASTILPGFSFWLYVHQDDQSLSTSTVGRNRIFRLASGLIVIMSMPG